MSLVQKGEKKEKKLVVWIRCIETDNGVIGVVMKGVEGRRVGKMKVFGCCISRRL